MPEIEGSGSPDIKVIVKTVTGGTQELQKILLLLKGTRHVLFVGEKKKLDMGKEGIVIERKKMPE